MKRWMFFGYGLVSYALFFAVYAYMACFVGSFLVPRSIDTPSGLPMGLAVAVNLLLLGMFGLQHSIMARPAFKRVWTRLVPHPIERSTYVLASNVVVVVLMGAWQGIDTVVWNVEQPVLRGLAWALFAMGWLMVPAVSLLIHHFDLFGMRQVWLHLRGMRYASLPFRTPLAYNHVRHPLYVGWALAFWATPTMTVGHLLFAVVLTGYMGLAAIIEERDLVAHFGRQYTDYRQRVPMFVPRLFGSKNQAANQNAEAVAEG